MARRKQMKHVKGNRSVGRRPKKNKKSVIEKKRIKNLIARQQRRNKDGI